MKEFIKIIYFLVSVTLFNLGFVLCTLVTSGKDLQNENYLTNNRVKRNPEYKSNTREHNYNNNNKYLNTSQHITDHFSTIQHNTTNAYGNIITEPHHGQLRHLGIPNTNIREHGVRREDGKRIGIDLKHNKGFVPQIEIDVVNDELHIINSDIEHFCQIECKEWEWMCMTSCVCIPKAERCDKIANCENEEDEKDCENYNEIYKKYSETCESSNSSVLCPRTYRCINKEWLCDGDNDCGDYGDESHCGAHVNCTEDQFECQNGFCIQKTWVCDGDDDCLDSSDEINCKKLPCTNEHFQCGDGFCVSISFRCDGDRDCGDGSDELNCENIMTSCPEGEFKCRSLIGGDSGVPSARCILSRFQCDGHNDCEDWSDEENCPNKVTSCTSAEYKCLDGTCIPNRWKCDGERDCEGAEDETNCETEIGKDTIKPCTPDEFACQSGRCIMNSWVCDGFPDCQKGEDEIDCQFLNICNLGEFLCPVTKNSSDIRICVPQKHICDGQNDCAYGEDEINCPKKKPCSSNSLCEQHCITTSNGKDECACRPGFVLHQNKYNCTDIDECEFVNNHVCSQICENVVGSFRCSCEKGYVMRPDLRSCKALGGAVELLVTNRWDIRRITLSNNRYVSVVKGLHNAIALDYHFEKNILFWSDVSTDVIKMTYLNGTKPRDIIKWGLESPGGIAVDWVHDLIFWTDSGTRRIEVSNFVGDVRVVLVANNLEKPRAIALHPGEGLLFFTDWGPQPKIESVYMDGQNRKVIQSKSIIWPNGLTIDYSAKKLYWADAKQHVIECSDFDGSKRTKILGHNLPHPFALTIFEDMMYWTDWSTKSVCAANKKTGTDFRKVHEDFHFPMDIHAYHPSRQPAFPNKCGKDRKGLSGGCSHICLPNKTSRTCACPIGLLLKEDKKTCTSMPGKLVLVARRKEIRLSKFTSTFSVPEIDMIVPLDGLKSTVAVDWCSKFDYIYWTDVERRSINRAHINGSNQQIIISTNLIAPAGLALDWITDKLYWTDSTNRIEVSDIDGRLRTVLIWNDLGKPRDIVVNPIDGNMFWTDWGSKPMIESASMDGTDRIILAIENLMWPNGLAIDFPAQKLYFVDGGKKTVEYMNFDGSNRKVVRNNLNHPFGLDVSENLIFWTDWEDKNLKMADKLTGKNEKIIIDNMTDLMDVRVFHRSRKFIQNPCSRNNGGCSDLCLLNTQGYSCACPIGVKLMNDLKTCQTGPSNFIVFAHRIDIRQISLEMEYLIDVVLPLPQVSNAVSVDVDLKTKMIFWSDTIEDVIMSSSADGMHVMQIISESIENVDDIVVDSSGRKIYWTDAGRRTIEVSNIDGSCRYVLSYKDIVSPRGIAIDYVAGLLFWTDWGAPKIEKSSMDGTARQKIITANLGWPNGLITDAPNKRIYWADGLKKHIESSDYDGNKREIIISSLLHPYSLALTSTYIYWTDWKSKALHRARRDLKNVTKYQNISQNIDGLMGIKVVMENMTIPENVCGINNGGCSHLCLRTPAGFSCKCPTGLKMKKGSSTNCEILPEKFLLVAVRSGIGLISLDTFGFMDVVLPISGVHGAVVLDFHYNKSLLFFADVNLDVIRRVNLLNVSDTTTIISKNLLTPNGIAVDWVADNIYWSDTDRKVIEVSRLDGTCRKAIVSEYLNDPRSLILHPKRGTLFWADWGSPPKIEKCLFDGTNRTAIVTENLGFPTGLAIDFDNRRLLWVDALQDRIEMSDFNGKRRSTIIQHASHPFGLTLIDDSIYWTDWYNKSVYHATKSTNGYRNIEEIRRSLGGALDIRAACSKRQEYELNECAIDNGGCSHLCFFRGIDYTCGCPDVPDSKHCVLKTRKLYENLSKLPDYSDADETTESSVPKNNSSKWNLMLLWSVIFTILFLIVMIIIIVLISKTKKKSNHRGTSRASSRSVLTFSNPNYNIPDGTPMDNKTTIWKRFKYDKNQDKMYEERNLTVETTSASLFAPSPSPLSTIA